MHYLPHLRKIITKRPKQKPARVKLPQPLDFHSERSKASIITGAEPTHLVDTVRGTLRPHLLLNETMDWSVGPCQDFYRFVCGRFKNKSSVRHDITSRFVDTVVEFARHEDVPAQGQTVAQKAARFFKTCYDIVTQETDYVPRIRGYMRDANLHWPTHPFSRDSESVDVFRSMLELTNKWGWSSLLEFYPEYLSQSSFEVVMRPTKGLDLFQAHAITLGLGSPAHRKYFEMLYSHYGGGVPNGVTFEEMLDYENEIMVPLIQVYYEPPKPYEFKKNYSDTSGVWEKWTSTIEDFYDLTGNEQITIFTTNQHYLECIIELIKTKEVIVELVIGWLAVQFTARFANRELIANYHNTLDQAEEFHRKTCFYFTGTLMGIALFLPYMERAYTEAVRADAWRITREVRRTVYQTLDSATYPWGELDTVFRFMEMTRVDDIEARFSEYPDMEASFVKNLRDVIKATSRTDIKDIGAMPPDWLFHDVLYYVRVMHDRHDYFLKPPILVPPMYHVAAPMPIRLGTFGVEVAKATLISYEQLRFEGHSTDWLTRFQLCFVRAARKERTEEYSPEWTESARNAMLGCVALDVALSVLKLAPSFDEDRLRYVPLTGHQLFYVAHCYTHCGERDGPIACNLPLRYKEDFANAFSCPTQSNMRSEYQCKSL